MRRPWGDNLEQVFIKNIKKCYKSLDKSAQKISLQTKRLSLPKFKAFLKQFDLQISHLKHQSWALAVVSVKKVVFNTQKHHSAEL